MDEESTAGERMRDADYRLTRTGANLSKKELQAYLNKAKQLLDFGEREGKNGTT